MKIKTVVLEAPNFSNLRYGGEGIKNLNAQLVGAIKVDIFQDFNGYVTFVGQWPDDADVPE